MEYWDGPTGNRGPCLKTVGHPGDHEHKSFCNHVSCTCGGLESRMNESDAKTYKLLRHFKDQIELATYEMEKKYHQYYTGLTLAETISNTDNIQVKKDNK